jgi:hypothetical protein
MSPTTTCAFSLPCSARGVNSKIAVAKSSARKAATPLSKSCAAAIVGTSSNAKAALRINIIIRGSASILPQHLCRHGLSRKGALKAFRHQPIASKFSHVIDELSPRLLSPTSPAPSGCAYFAPPPATSPHAPKRHCQGQLVRRRPRRASGTPANRVWPGNCSDCPLPWLWLCILGRCGHCAWGSGRFAYPPIHLEGI